MEKKYYPLEHGEANTFTKVLRVIFGIICILVALYWLIFSPAPVLSKLSLYTVFLFLIFFGIAQIWNGLGKGTKFIEFGNDKILLKKSTIFPPFEIKSADLVKIELHPMNTIFLLKSGKKMLLRFGATYQETNENIKDELLIFSDVNNVPIEMIEEKI